MKTESEIQEQIRIDTSKMGWRLWRNNVGAGFLESGNFIRYGLANSSAMENSNIKSGDLIGIRPVLITQDMVGQTIGQFVSIECKKSTWEFNERSPRDLAQNNWKDLINKLGGYALFSTGDI